MGGPEGVSDASAGSQVGKSAVSPTPGQSKGALVSGQTAAPVPPRNPLYQLAIKIDRIFIVKRPDESQEKGQQTSEATSTQKKKRSYALSDEHLKKWAKKAIERTTNVGKSILKSIGFRRGPGAAQTPQAETASVKRVEQGVVQKARESSSVEVTEEDLNDLEDLFLNQKEKWAAVKRKMENGLAGENTSGFEEIVAIQKDVKALVSEEVQEAKSAEIKRGLVTKLENFKKDRLEDDADGTLNVGGGAKADYVKAIDEFIGALSQGGAPQNAQTEFVKAAGLIQNELSQLIKDKFRQG